MISNVLAGENVHWDYSETGHEGPKHWGELDLSFITINYQSGGNEILNNGHTIQVNYKPGSTIRLPVFIP